MLVQLWLLARFTTYFYKLSENLSFPTHVGFSLYPTSPPHAFSFVFSACFFHCSAFCFLFLFLTFERPPSHCSLLIPCSAEKYLQQQSFFEVSDKRSCWFSAARTCDTMRAVGGFTARVKIWAGLNFLVNLLKWLCLILCMRRSQVQRKVFAGFGELFSTYISVFFAYNSYDIKYSLSQSWGYLYTFRTGFS